MDSLCFRLASIRFLVVALSSQLLHESLRIFLKLLFFFCALVQLAQVFVNLGELVLPVHLHELAELLGGTDFVGSDCDCTARRHHLRLGLFDLRRYVPGNIDFADALSLRKNH